MKVMTVKRSAIVVKDNIRNTMQKGSIKRLSESIDEHGILQPLLVRDMGNGSFELIAGHRRIAAADTIKMTELPVLVQDIDDSKRTEIQLVENLQREDLNPIDEALAYKELGEDYSDRDIVVMTGKSLYHIKKVKSLMSLCTTVRNLIKQEKMSADHGYVIARLTNPESQKKLANRVIDDHLSPLQTENDLRDFTMSLEEVGFDKKDCKKCPFNSEKITDLFDDDSFYNANCLNEPCFRKKMNDHIEKIKKEFSDAGYKVKILPEGKSMYSVENVKDLEGYEFKEYFKKKDFNKECLNGCDAYRIIITDAGIPYKCCLNEKCAKRKVKAMKRAIASAKNGNKAESIKDKKGLLQEVKKQNRIDAFKRQFYIPQVEEKMTDLQMIRLTVHQLMESEPSSGTTLSDMFGFDEENNYLMRNLSRIQDMDETSLLQCMRFLIEGRLKQYTTEELEALGKEAGTHIEKEFEITEEYLLKYSKDELLKLLKDLNILNDEPALKVLSKKKKTDMIAHILKMDVKGKVPKEMT